MTELRIEHWTMPGAELGAENPLPSLERDVDLHQVEVSAALPADMRENISYGHVPNILPYTMQDGYTRQRKPMTFKVAVLENDILRAVFLLEYGGRLWSLLHKPTGRDLLRVNPVFQPANLALRNAWFSGGVEWNIGTIGHTPLTCSPMFAARIEGDDGVPILRLYEWERMRQVPFQIDFFLPDGSPVLFVYVRIVNPHSHDVPMYWWSNIAVPETPDTRVLVPAESAYRFDYGRTLEILPVPQFDGVDRTYSTQTRRAIDYFFPIPDERRPWIAALDGTGKGLAQFSTRRLRGRKLFLWGTGRGGTRWQNFLSEPGYPYIEIQAGLARTQLEHLRMPAGAEWSWLEGYGLVETDSAAAHGSDWGQARQAVEQGIKQLIAPDEFDAIYEQYRTVAERPPAEMLHHGTGWGTLERKRRARSGEANFAPASMPFEDAALGEQQQAWLTLLETGNFPDSDPQIPPLSFMVQTEWRALLEESLKNSGQNWAAWCHVGVMRYHAGDKEAARAAWEQSLAQQENAWALRNLAVDARSQQRFEEAANLVLRAHHLKPELRALTIETGNALIAAGRAQECLTMIEASADRAHGRIRLIETQAALAVGDLERAERILDSQFVVDDIREGDTTLTDLWQSLHEQKLSRAESRPIDEALRAQVRQDYPLPDHYNFKMLE